MWDLQRSHHSEPNLQGQAPATTHFPQGRPLLAVGPTKTILGLMTPTRELSQNQKGSGVRALQRLAQVCNAQKGLGMQKAETEVLDSFTDCLSHPRSLTLRRPSQSTLNAAHAPAEIITNSENASGQDSKVSMPPLLL